MFGPPGSDRMGLPRKGCRPIIVVGVPYRWLLRCAAVCREMLFWPEHLYIEQAERPGQRLAVRFGYPVWHLVGGQRQYPTPALVRRIIRDALAAGWQPARPGLPPFALDGHAYLLPAEQTGYD